MFSYLFYKYLYTCPDLKGNTLEMFEIEKDKKELEKLKEILDFLEIFYNLKWHSDYLNKGTYTDGDEKELTTKFFKDIEQVTSSDLYKDLYEKLKYRYFSKNYFANKTFIYMGFAKVCLSNINYPCFDKEFKEICDFVATQNTYKNGIEYLFEHLNLGSFETKETFFEFYNNPYNHKLNLNTCLSICGNIEYTKDYIKDKTSLFYFKNISKPFGYKDVEKGIYSFIDFIFENYKITYDKLDIFYKSFYKPNFVNDFIKLAVVTTKIEYKSLTTKQQKELIQEKLDKMLLENKQSNDNNLKSIDKFLNL